MHLDDHIEHSTLVALIARDLAKADHDRPAWNALTGTVLGPYRLELQIGEGANGVVYRAQDTRLGRPVAVKTLHTAELTQLMAEARAAAAVEHPNIVTIYDVGAVGDTAYIAMELVEGETLRTILKRGPLSGALAHGLSLELARGLAVAHARGVVHRDLKPANLIVTRQGHLKILDFGLAKRAGASPVDATRPGTVQGTAGYMAPEQARAEPTDARTDLFTVGAIMFEMLTGRRAFDGPTYHERVAAILDRTPDLSELGPFTPIVERCLAKHQVDRFHSAADLAWALSMLPVTKDERCACCTPVTRFACEMTRSRNRPALLPEKLTAIARSAIPVLRRWIGRWPTSA